MIKVERFVNNTLSSNTYLVYKEDNLDCLLIDCGDSKEVYKSIESHSLNPVAILLTHAHHDHIYGINDFLEKYPNVRIYTNDFGKAALLSAKLNLSKYAGTPFEVTKENAIVVLNGLEQDGAALERSDLLGMNIDVLSVPGHNPSCLAYRIDNYLFSGDAYIPGVKVVTVLPKADKTLAQKNYALLEDMARGMIVCAGHGDIVTFEKTKSFCNN